MIKRLLFSAYLFLCLAAAHAQFLYYQNTFKGGASLDGITYTGQSWTQSDSITFQNAVPAGCTLKKALLVASKFTCLSTGNYPDNDAPVAFSYNNHTILFDSSDNVTPRFLYGLSGAYSKRCYVAKDVTSLSQSSNNLLVTPCQCYSNACDQYNYNGFFLLLLYQNNTYSKVNVALYLNTANKNTTPSSFVFMDLNPIDTLSDVGLSIESDNVNKAPFLPYKLSTTTNTVTLGTLRQVSASNTQNYHTGAGSFHIENDTLWGLVDDSPNAFIDTTDALVNLKSYLPNNTTTFTLTANVGPLSSASTFTNNYTNAFALAYSTPCPVTPSNADSIKVYAFCTNSMANTQIKAGSGYASYSWYPTTGLSNANIYNPVVNTSGSANYICYVKDAAGCMHTEHAQVIIHPIPTPQSISTTTAICGGSKGKLNFVPNNSNYGCSYSLNNIPQTATSFANLTAGPYTLTIRDTTLGCLYTYSFTVKDTNLAKAFFYSIPSAGCAPLTVNCLNLSNSLNNASNAYVWHTKGDSATTSNFTYTYADTGKYVISLFAYETFRSCGATFTQTVTVNEYCPPDSLTLTIPNIFTPNSDGKNDFWFIIQHNYQCTVNMFECNIYDRWGNKTHTINNINDFWSGKDAKEGTYFYVINYQYTGNTKGNVETKTAKGFLELIK